MASKRQQSSADLWGAKPDSLATRRLASMTFPKARPNIPLRSLYFVQFGSGFRAFTHCWFRLAILILNIVLCCAGICEGQDSCCKALRHANADLDDVLALGISPHKIIIATQENASHWRYRVYPLSLDGPGVSDAALSAAGTQVAVLYQDGKHFIYELSTPSGPILKATHTLPGQTYELRAQDGNPVFLNESNEPISLTSPSTSDGKQTTDKGTPLFDDLETIEKNEFPGAKWKFSTSIPNCHLYAAVLEFAREENVFPTDVNIWTPLHLEHETYTLKLQRQPSHHRPNANILEKYLQSSLQEGARVVYYSIRSYFGFWLYEYWTYYLFDTGGISPHTHDTEHLFVEVDKLGGRIVGVLAQAHTDIVPNNIYSALTPANEPAKLPIFAFVERGKHTTAPDINRDGKFTPGVDVNIPTENAHVWGIRDAIGLSDAHMLPYAGGMTLPRDFALDWAEEEFDKYFPSYNVEGLTITYKLVPFPSPSPSTLPPQSLCDQHPDNTDCAIREFVVHPDAQNPEHIYKKWVFPFTQVRVDTQISMEGTISASDMCQTSTTFPVTGACPAFPCQVE